MIAPPIASDPNLFTPANDLNTATSLIFSNGIGGAKL